MVSSSVSDARRAKAQGSYALTALCVWLGMWLLVGCKSECLRDDCQTAAPVETPSPLGSAGSSGSNGSAGSSGSAGAASIAMGKPCQANDECQADQGQSCVEGTCRFACASHFDCQGFGVCTTGTDTDGKPGHYCALGEQQPAGQFYTHCPSGTDAECDAANAFFCVSAGAADLDAYCTKDCTDDSACAAGYACTPLTRTPCLHTCGLKGDAKDRTCIPPDQIGVGKAFQCGKRGVTRNACRPRKFCSGCERDSDCLAATGQVCAKDQSGAKICTELCDLKHPSCPWGNAGTCGVWDADLGLATCAHRFGKCIGTGKGCEPCLKDADCGSNGACNSSSFTGERWCVDLNEHCDCGADNLSGLCTGGGCSKSPSGIQMLCADSSTTSIDDGVCVGANTNTGVLATNSQQTGCWPPK